MPILIVLMTPPALPAADISEGMWVMAWNPMDEIINVAKISRGTENDWKLKFVRPGIGVIEVPLTISGSESGRSRSASGGAQVWIQGVDGKKEVRTIALHISFAQDGPAFGKAVFLSDSRSTEANAQLFVMRPLAELEEETKTK